MKLISILLILVAFFLGLGFLIHICSKNRYALTYYSQKRKIEIYPAQDKSHQPSWDKGRALLLSFILLY